MAAVFESALVSGSTFDGVTGAAAIRNGAFSATDAMIVVGSFSDRVIPGSSLVSRDHSAEAITAFRTQRRVLTPSTPEQLSAELLSA